MSDSKYFDVGSWSPFLYPVPVPGSLPSAAPHQAICINHDWIPYVVAALKSLTRPESWAADPSTLEAMMEDLWGVITKIESACMSDEAFRQHDNCLLQRSTDGGVTWTTVFDASLCVRSLVPNPTAPQPLGPPPSLVCTDYPMLIPAWDVIPLPVSVSAGDTVAIVAHGSDLWTDDSIGYVSGINNGYCVGGQVADPVTGVCGVSEPSHAGDPLASANHMELILAVAGVFYRVLASTITIPSGLANVRAFLLANDSALPNNLGTQQVTAEICTNRWYHTFDFSLGAQLGWTNARHMPWVGNGFQADADNVDCNVDSPTMTTGVVTFFEHFYDPPLACGTTAIHCAYARPLNDCFGPLVFGCGSDFLEDVGANTTHYNAVSAYTHNRSDASETPKHKLVKVILGGTGTEPIWP